MPAGCRQSEDLDRPERFCGNDRVCCKETDKQDADGTRKDEEQSGVCRSKDKDVLLRTLYSVGLSGSEIVGKNSLSSAGDTAERHGDYEREALAMVAQVIRRSPRSAPPYFCRIAFMVMIMTLSMAMMINGVKPMVSTLRISRQL